MDKLCKYIDKELEELENKVGMGGKLSRADIEDGKNLAKFKMAILTNEAMEENSDYSGEYSGARGRGRNARRDSMGRYSGTPYYGERMYSREDSRDEMMEHLREMEKSAPDERTKRMVKEWIRQAECE